MKRNDRVLIFMDNCWEAVVSIFARSEGRRGLQPDQPSTKADKLAFILTDCRAAAILTQAKLLPVVAEAVGDRLNLRWRPRRGRAARPMSARRSFLHGLPR